MKRYDPAQALPASIDHVQDRVFTALRSWAGFSTLTRIMNLFPEVDVYLAGGVVRNALLDRAENSKDFDFFLAGERVEAAIAAWAKSGSMEVGPFGSPRWYPDRSIPKYCDLARIDRFSTGLWACEDIIDALNQFDFTGNAVAVDLRSGRLFDPQNGRRDLTRRILRAVRFDYPDEPIVPGHSLSRLVVLWFRLVHYATALDLEIEPITHNWLTDRIAYRAQLPTFTAVFFAPHTDNFFLAGGSNVEPQ